MACTTYFAIENIRDLSIVLRQKSMQIIQHVVKHYQMGWHRRFRIHRHPGSYPCGWTAIKSIRFVHILHIVPIEIRLTRHKRHGHILMDVAAAGAKKRNKNQ